MSEIGMACHDASIRLAARAPTGRAYSYGNDPFQRLLVHAASEPTGEVVLAWHGGGWTHGFKEWMSMMAPPLNRRGISLVSAGYRLAPEHLFPRALDDCEAALTWLAGHLSEIDGDPDRVFLGGHSAGGHYAGLMALRPARPGRLRIAGCLPISGVYRLGQGSGLARRPRFLGPALSPEVDRAASPLAQSLTDAPPFFITWGEHDFPHLIHQAREMARALRQVGVPVRTLELPGCDHFEACYATAVMDGAWVREATAFMRSEAAVATSVDEGVQQDGDPYRP